MKKENLNISTEIWYRSSTDEWVIDFEVTFPDVINYISRFSGKTQLEALESMKEHIDGKLDDIINAIKNS